MRAWGIVLATIVSITVVGLVSMAISLHSTNAELSQQIATLEVTPTRTPTATSTHTPTTTPSATMAPTPTATWTPVPTNTPLPTSTPGPDPEQEFYLGADLMCQYANFIVTNFTSGAYRIGDCQGIIDSLREGDWYNKNELRKTATPQATETRPYKPTASSLG